MNIYRFLENKWALSISAGVLLGLSFPPFNIAFLAFPAFIFLLRLADISSSYKQLAYYSYGGFVVWNIIGTYWLTFASLPAGIAAILANSVIMTIPLCMAAFFARRIKSPYLIAFLQAAAWVSYEFLHHHWDLSWTWLTIGNAWANYTVAIQYISVTGYLGISFWVLLTAALAYQAFTQKSRTLLYATTGVFLIFPILSFVLYDGDAATISSSDTTEVAIIQPNHDSYQDYGGMENLSEVVDSLLSLTKRTLQPSTDLVIWPENAIDGYIYAESYTANRIADSAKTWNVNLIIGSGLIKTYPEDSEGLFRGVLKAYPHQGQPYNIFNAALFIAKDGTVSDYEKANLVPIVERVPFLETLSALDVFNWVNWGAIGGFGKGKEPKMIETQAFTAPGLICYDSVYPSWIRHFVQNDATFLTIITNDGWWGNTSGHLQHFAYARLRAIEFNRWIARSANNGISGIIAPNGKVVQKTQYWVRTGVTGIVQNLYSQTFYTRFGDWLAYLCLLMSIPGWIYLRFFKK